MHILEDFILKICSQKEGGGETFKVKAYLTLLRELGVRIVRDEVDEVLQTTTIIINIRMRLLGSHVSRKTFIFNYLFCALIGRSPLNRKHLRPPCAVPLTTDFRVLWTARILFPMENLMHFTSPLSSILRRNHHRHDAVSNLNPDYLSAVKQSVFPSQRLDFPAGTRYLKATLLLSSGPLTTTPVAPPERTANTCRRTAGSYKNERNKKTSPVVTLKA